MACAASVMAPDDVAMELFYGRAAYVYDELVF